MRLSIIPVSAVIAVFLLSCSSKRYDVSQQSTSSKAQQLAQQGCDASLSDDNSSSEQVIAPSQPSVSAPTAGATVNPGFTVSGSTEAYTTVTVTLLDAGSTQLEQQKVLSEKNGDFSLQMPYSAVTAGSNLTLKLSASNSAGSSSEKEVALQQGTTYPVNGTFEDTTGNLAGDKIYIRAYSSASEYIDYISEKVINVTDGATVAAQAFSLNLPDGTYYLRAFRDKNSDAQPQRDEDQGVYDSLSAVTVAGATATLGATLSLDKNNVTDHFNSLNVLTNNSSIEYTPRDGSNNPGSGTCGGYTLLFFAEASSTSVSAPVLKTPQHRTVTALDDGACGQAVADNTSMSYDESAGDNRYSYGFPEPDSRMTGDYLMAYQITSNKFLHIEADKIEEIIRLSRDTYITSPSAESAVTDLTPSVTFKKVDNADNYSVHINGVTYIKTADFEIPSGNQLPDDSAISATVEALATDSFSEIDALSRGRTVTFITDTDGASTSSIIGNITNLKSACGNYFIKLEDSGTNNTLSAVYIDQSDISYSLNYLTGVATTGRLTGEIMTENKRYSVSHDSISLSSTQIIKNLKFTRSPELTSPSAQASGTGNQPSFSWADYSEYAPQSEWIYGLFVTSSPGGGFPEIVYAVDKNTTDFSLSSPSAEALDIIHMLTGSPSAADLSSSTSWYWGIIIIECSLNDSTCISSHISADNFYAQSESSFSTD